jgi:hypothetical protein
MSLQQHRSMAGKPGVKGMKTRGYIDDFEKFIPVRT